ncbi:MAG: hypothetical protein MJE77_39295, partial [Proteobacteria bacterium]|nr:hypothetical protein [Pseudomonadota bacterium]
RIARAPIHHRQRACSSVKYNEYSPLLAHPLAARLVALARSEVFGPALIRKVSPARTERRQYGVFLRLPALDGCSGNRADLRNVLSFRVVVLVVAD